MRFPPRPASRPRALLAIACLACAVAACVAKPEPVAPPAPPRAVPLPAPAPTPLAADWRDWPQTPGTWAYARDARGSRAMFGMAGADARLLLRCDMAERRVYLSRAGDVRTPLTVRTSSTARTLPVQSTGGTLPYVATALAAADPLLDAMAFSRGRFVVEQAGATPVVAPAWAEVGRVVEDCRG